MLVLGARNAKIGGQRLCALQGGLRLDDGDLIRNPRFILSACEVKGLLIGGNRGVEDLLEGILPAKLEEQNGQAGLLGEAFVFKIGGAELGRVLRLAYCIAYFSPEIGLPGGLGWQVNERARGDRSPSGGSCGIRQAPVELSKLEELRERDQEGPVDTVGKSWACAWRTMARAAMKFSKNCLMFWLLMLSCSSSAFNSGSL